mgnify:CR=1 FL=1|tara:strand:+ start:143 stop:802 length:660 start_codon:yes stop_codon:yes gene_type:complete
MSEIFVNARKNMVINQLRPNKINEENILKIFENTPKENYLDVSLGKSCYLDKNLDIIENRGYLKNLHLAQMIKYSNISPNDKVLHIGGLTGYFSALISSLCKELLVVEENKELFKLLEQNIKNVDTKNINLFNNNLLDGLNDNAPFNLIIIDGPIFKIGDNLKKQLDTNGGKLVYIKKIYDNLGKAYKILRNEDLYSSEYLFDVMSNYQIQEQQKDFRF